MPIKTGIGRVLDYQLKSEKDVANGYPSLDAGGKVPIAELPTGAGAGLDADTLDTYHAAAFLFNGGIIVGAVRSQSTDAIVSFSTDFVLNISAISGNRTVTFPQGGSTGQIIIVRKNDSTANTITLQAIGGGGATFNGMSTYVLNRQFQTVVLICVGAPAWIIASDDIGISGTYLPLVAGGGNPLTGDLYINKDTPGIQLKHSGSTRGLISATNTELYVRSFGAGTSLYLGSDTYPTIINGSTITATAPLAMGANKITDLAAAVAAGDAVRYDQLTSISNGAMGQLKPNVTRYTQPGWMIVRDDDSFTMTGGYITYVPIFVASSTTFTETVFNVAGAGGGGSTMDIRIFAWNDGVPGAQVVNVGTVATASTGTKTITANYTLDRGFYFVAFRNNLAVTVNSINWSFPVSCPIGGMGPTTAPSSNFGNWVGMYVNSAYADPAPAPTAISINFPAFKLREN